MLYLFILLIIYFNYILANDIIVTDQEEDSINNINVIISLFKRKKLAYTSLSVEKSNYLTNRPARSKFEEEKNKLYQLEDKYF